MEKAAYLKEDAKMTRQAMAVVISSSLIIYATGFLYAWHTQTSFMVNLFTVEAILAAVVVYIATKTFHH